MRGVDPCTRHGVAQWLLDAGGAGGSAKRSEASDTPLGVTSGLGTSVSRVALSSGVKTSKRCWVVQPRRVHV